MSQETTAVQAPPLDAVSITPEEGYNEAEVTNFFEEEVVTEAMLRGEDLSEGEETPSESGDEENAEPPASDENKTDDDKDEETETETETEDNSEGTEEETSEQETEPEPTKPPKGFVPYKALAEERNKRKELAQQLAELQEAVEMLGTKEADKEEEFKQLSDEELETLIEEDPQEALRYQVRLQRHQAKQRAINIAKNRDEMAISEGVVEIQTVLPDIYEEGSKTATELADFAVENGFDPDYLPLLTDPRTKLIAPDGKTRMVLGTGAASVIRILNEMRNKASVDTESLRHEIEKEITEKVTQQILAKMKKGESSTAVSINDLPGSPEEIRGDTVLTEAEMAKMSKDELDAYLRGG